jgi:hypothetical protein
VHNTRRTQSADRGGRSLRLADFTSEETISARFGQLFNQRREAELTLAAALLADPKAGAAAARGAGVKYNACIEEDVRLILGALIVLFSEGKLTGDWEQDQLRVGSLSKKALKAAGKWDDDEVPGNRTSYWWSDRKLAALLQAEPFSVPFISMLARQLASLNQRIADVETVHRQLMVLVLADIALPGSEMAVAA